MTLNMPQSTQRLDTAFDIQPTQKIINDDNSIVVNVHNTDRFIDSHLRTQDRLIVKEAYPELYDRENKGLHFKRFEIRDIDSLHDNLINKYGKQKGRASSNQKMVNIRNDILENGFKLKYNPIAIAEYADGSFKFLTGRTRVEILKKNCDFKNAIVAVYSVTDNKTLATNNLKFNLIDSPIGLATTGDVIAVGQELIDDGDISKNLDEINDWVNEVAEGSHFTANTKNIIAQSLLNNNASRPLINSWTPERVHDWMIQQNYMKAGDQYPSSGLSSKESVYVQTKEGPEHLNKYLYVIGAASSWSKNLSRVSAIANNQNFAGKIIRILLHTSTLDTLNTIQKLEEQYQDKIDKHNLNFNQEVLNIGNSYFTREINGEVVQPIINTRIVIYASLPVIGKVHKQNELVVF
tara:strand:+ start:124 stop:1344 length:1221 start_codon:yes stop_codon:yes gene_type:complete